MIDFVRVVVVICMNVSTRFQTLVAQKQHISTTDVGRHETFQTTSLRVIAVVSTKGTPESGPP